MTSIDDILSRLSGVSTVESVLNLQGHAKSLEIVNVVNVCLNMHSFLKIFSSFFCLLYIPRKRKDSGARTENVTFFSVNV